jgi:hypothetical protein
MSRTPSALAVCIVGVLCGTIGGLVGYRLGAGAALSAEFTHRGVIATQHIAKLRVGQTATLVGLMETDIDNGLVWGDDLLRSSSRFGYQPILGFPGIEGVRASVLRLAQYRIANPGNSNDTLASSAAAIARAHASPR